MNGLSALGSGVAGYAATAGLEAQKADVAQQLQQSGGVIQGNLQQQKAALDATAAALAADVAKSAATQEQAAALTRTNVTEAGATARNTATINAPTPEMKLLRALGVPLAGDAPTPNPSSPSAGISGAATPPAASPSGLAAPPPSATASPDPSSNLLVGKVLGLPVPGSEASVRYAIAQAVKSDPKFAGSSPAALGAQAAEIGRRVAVASGTMIDPESQEINSSAIAGYRMAPPTGQAASREGAAETMALALKKNPDYQPGRFDEIKTAMTAFGSGPQGDRIRFLDTGVQHAAVFDKAIDALGNNNVGALNLILNPVKTALGVSAPNTFNGMKQLVGTEIGKAISGGLGTGEDRDRIMSSLSDARSPDQLHDVVDSFRSLMTGQLTGLKQQYIQSTGIKRGEFAFETKLAPETVQALTEEPKSTTTTAPTTSYPGTGSDGMPYATTTTPAAVAAPKPPAIGEVQQGYSFSGGNPADPNSWKPVAK